MEGMGIYHSLRLHGGKLLMPVLRPKLLDIVIDVPTFQVALLSLVISSFISSLLLFILYCLINAGGRALGIQATVGHGFIGATWTATVLVMVAGFYWLVNSFHEVLFQRTGGRHPRISRRSMNDPSEPSTPGFEENGVSDASETMGQMLDGHNHNHLPILPPHPSSPSHDAQRLSRFEEGPMDENEAKG